MLQTVRIGEVINVATRLVGIHQRISLSSSSRRRFGIFAIALRSVIGAVHATFSKQRCICHACAWKEGSLCIGLEAIPRRHIAPQTVAPFWRRRRLTFWRRCAIVPTAAFATVFPWIAFCSTHWTSAACAVCAYIHNRVRVDARAVQGTVREQTCTVDGLERGSGHNKVRPWHTCSQ